MQARKSIVMQWNYILLVVHYSVLVMLNAHLCDFSFLGWMRLNLFASLLLHQVGILLVHPKSLNPGLPYESTIPTYMRYSRAVLSKFVCAISNFQNNFPFVCSYHPWNGRGWLIFFHARCVILKMSVYSLVIAREYDKGIRDAQSRNEKGIYFTLSNNKFLGKCWYGRHPWIRLAWNVKVWWKKE